MKVVAATFARGGSKGLPGKNILPLVNKPLIAWSIEQTLALKSLHRMIVSTDAPDIAEIAIQYGAEVPFLRPPELATDNSPEWLSWRHLLNFLLDDEGELPDVLLSVPATSPLRVTADLEQCIQKYFETNADVVITVCPSYRNPYFNMVSLSSEGDATLAIRPEYPIYRRQDAPELFDMTTVAYAIKPSFVLSASSLFDGRIAAIQVPPERSVDIDNLLDFKFAEFLLTKNS